MIVLRRCLWLLVAALALLAGGGTPVGGGAVAAQPPSVRFVENVGQWPDALRFRTMGGTQRWAVADRALWLTLYDAASDGNQTGLQLRFDLSGASPNSRWEAVEPLGGSLSFYEGASRYERVPQWGGLRLRGYREGVDLLLGSDSAGLRVTLLPTMLGAVLPRAIPLELHGASATLGADGAALAVSNGGEQRMARLPRGVAWRVATPSGDVLTVRPTATARGDAPSTFSLLYSSFLGSEATDELYKVKGLGNDLYAVGYTSASIFPTRPGLFSTQHVIDAVVVRVDITDPSDYMIALLIAVGGGDLEEFGNDIALDSSGNLYVVGETNSTTFPVTAGAYDTSFNGVLDAFVAKLSPSGTLLYSTFFGGAELDRARAVLINQSGDVTVAGGSVSTDLPTTPDAYRTVNAGARDAWVARFDSTLSSLQYSTFIGGEAQDEVTALERTGSRLYMTGWTNSPNFPVTATAYAAQNSGNFDSFVTQLDPGATTLAYSSYLGGSNEDRPTDIDVDGAGRMTVVGYSRSPNYPVTSGAFGTTFGGGNCIVGPCTDGFLSRFSAAGGLEVSGILGGSDEDQWFGVDVDEMGNYYLTGVTESTNWPVTSDAYSSTFSGEFDMILTKISASGQSLRYSSYLGRSDGDKGWDVDWVAPDRLYVVGQTQSTDFPIAGAAYNSVHNGDVDGVMMQWQIDDPNAAHTLFLPLVAR